MRRLAVSQRPELRNVELVLLRSPRRPPGRIANDLDVPSLLETMDDPPRLLFRNPDLLGDCPHRRVKAPPLVVAPIRKREHHQQFATRCRESVPYEGHNLDAH